MDWRTATNEDALRDWDAGDLVWSCSMGGMGPGYEQCIQIMGFEMLRAMLGMAVDWQKAQDDRDYWRGIMDEVDKVPAVKETVHRLGPSGAQHGAAMNIASVFARNGYAKGMEMAPEDRRIMVSKNFPQ